MPVSPIQPGERERQHYKDVCIQISRGELTLDSLSVIQPGELVISISSLCFIFLESLILPDESATAQFR